MSLFECARRLAIGAPIAIAALAFSAVAHGKDFRNSYVSFTLPDRWDCEFRDTEFVCRNANDAQAKREAVIILTAKEVGAQDTFADYDKHLKTPRMLPSRTGVPQASKIIPINQAMRKINDQMWIDGMHLSSEVANYYTRYLATIKDRIAILVTFSAHISAYSRYVQDFFRAMNSLRVVLVRSDIAGGNGNARGDAGGTLGPGGGIGFADLPPEMDEQSSGGGGGLGSMLGFLGFLVGAIGLYLLLKNRKKKSKLPTRRR